jgi:hypothetical protein
MTNDELREEAVTLALMLDDEFGQSAETVDYIAAELMMSRDKVHTLLMPEMFDN